MCPDSDIVVTDFHPRTSDGWQLELKRYRLRAPSPADSAPASLPVVLCHGFSCNARFWDLTDDVSFARYLARRGYDVWVPSLRGSGSGAKPLLFIFREIFQFKAPLFRRPGLLHSLGPGWNFDDHVLGDLPAIIDAVKRATARSKVIWVGHSMGGLAMYAYLERSGRDDVAAFVALASPIHLPQPPNRGYRLAVRSRTLVRLGRTLFNNQVFAGIGILTGRVSMDYMWWSRRNVRASVVRAFYRNVIDDVPEGLLEQLSTTVLTGSLWSADGSFNYTAGLARVTVPILCVAGKVDNICDPADVRFACENAGSADKTCMEMGRADGFSADYGHLDLILGRNASNEVFPLIADWLSRHNRT